MAFIAPKEELIHGGGFRAPQEDLIPNDTNGKGRGLLGNLSRAAALYKESPIYKASPVGMLNKANELMTAGFNKAGEKTAEFLGSAGANPKIAAAAGTAVQMAPDIAMALSPQKAEVGLGAAKSLVRRGLGYTKATLKTPFARGQAAKAAEVALEKGVVPTFGNPTVAYERASQLASSAGEKIGKTLDRIGFEQIAPDAERDLEIFRSAITKGTDRGLFAGANETINNIKTTILELYGRGASAKAYNQAKNILGKSLNYLSDLSSQSVNKKSVNAMATTIRNGVKKLVPENYLEFVNNQRLFNAAESMKTALNPELAAQMGNNIVTPTGTIVAATQAMGGNIPQAVASLGLTELLKRRGSLAIGKQLYNFSKSRVSATPNAILAASRLTTGRGKNQKENK